MMISFLIEGHLVYIDNTGTANTLTTPGAVTVLTCWSQEFLARKTTSESGGLDSKVVS